MSLIDDKPLSWWSPKNFKDLNFGPNSGSLTKDIIFILVVCFIQSVIFPTFDLNLLSIDIVTPWIMITAVRQNAAKATIIGFIAAITLEMHSTIPAGLYLIAYWIAINIIIQIRSALSWRHLVPWFVTYFVATVWLQMFVSFVLFLSRGPETFTLLFWLQNILKVASGVAIGLYFSREWLSIDGEEPVPK
ncbi:MAG: hypothetical protein HRU19_04070 [Pseudobacteriovorax sp.]|nr:hypothetical protein [Pseudobacteriovorax sp.]